MLTDDFGLEVGVVEVREVHHHIVQADHSSRNREDCGDDETVLVEGGLAVFVAVCETPLGCLEGIDGYGVISKTHLSSRV